MTKILHLADLYVDAPFRCDSARKAEQRRKEFRDTFSGVISFVRSEEIGLVLIAGDLFDRDHVTPETAEFLAGAFASAPACRFVIAPGDRDPYQDGYRMMTFPDNVHVFSSPSFSCFSFPELDTDVYGYGFAESTLPFCPFAGKKPADDRRLNLLCGHGEVGVSASEYCPIRTEDLKGFDYAALGHIHCPDGPKRVGEGYYAYAGCTEGRDFTEPGYGGAVLIAAEKKDGVLRLSARRVPFSGHRYETLTADITGIADGEGLKTLLREALQKRNYGADTSLRVILRGEVSLSLDIRKDRLIRELGGELFALTIEDHTLPICGGEVWERDPTLKGAFYRELLPLLRRGNEEQKLTAAAALRLGFSAMEKGSGGPTRS